MAWCVLFKGPCRGNACDYWARVRLRKMDVAEITTRLVDFIEKHGTDGTPAYEHAIGAFWRDFGVKSIERLQQEEPELYAKMREAEVRAQHRVASSSLRRSDV
ncbi:MAG: hypothetical protein ACP6IT_04595 [Candidatus Thorarchaeota archaeon]